MNREFGANIGLSGLVRDIINNIKKKHNTYIPH